MIVFDLIGVMPEALAELFEWTRLATTCMTGPNFDAANPVFDSAIRVCTA